MTELMRVAAGFCWHTLPAGATPGDVDCSKRHHLAVQRRRTQVSAAVSQYLLLHIWMAATPPATTRTREVRCFMMTRSRGSPNTAD